MKRSLAVLALLTLSSASLCAAENYNREKVLALFAQYNPTVLEKAQQNEDYNAIVQGVASAYDLPQTEENYYELVALIRNFDNSLELNALAAAYKKKVSPYVENGQDFTALSEQFRQDLVPVFSRLWAVSVQVHTQHLKEAKARVKDLKKDASLTKEQKEEALKGQTQTISFLKKEIKNLKKDSAAQVVLLCDIYAAKVGRNLSQELLQSKASLEAHNTAVNETANLSVVSKNKKPVAK